MKCTKCQIIILNRKIAPPPRERKETYVEKVKRLTGPDPIEAQAQLSIQKDIVVGPNEPTLTFAGMMWIDTSGSEVIMKQRNKTNNDWIIVTNQVTFGQGDPT